MRPELKQLLNSPSTEEIAQETLLSDESAAMQLLCLTLLLPVPEAAAVTITIFLALSFSQRHGDMFTLDQIPYIEENTNNYKSSARVRSTPATRPYESLALKTISTRPKP